MRVVLDVRLGKQIHSWISGLGKVIGLRKATRRKVLSFWLGNTDQSIVHHVWIRLLSQTLRAQEEGNVDSPLNVGGVDENVLCA